MLLSRQRERLREGGGAVHWERIDSWGFFPAISALCPRTFFVPALNYMLTGCLRLHNLVFASPRGGLRAYTVYGGSERDLEPRVD